MDRWEWKHQLERITVFIHHQHQPVCILQNQEQWMNGKRMISRIGFNLFRGTVNHNSSSFHFFIFNPTINWPQKQQMNSALPDPSFVLWDNSEEFCLIVYPTHFSIFEVRPTFKFIITVNFSISTAVWGNGFLVYANQNSIECCFVLSFISTHLPIIIIIIKLIIINLITI